MTRSPHSASSPASRPDPVLCIRLFGGLALDFDDKPLPRVATRPARSLFAFLVTYRKRAHTRDLLAGTFWPELPEAQARRRLSQALWRIGQVLNPLSSPEPFIVSSADTLQFNPRALYWLDVEEFEKALKQIQRSEDDIAASEWSALRQAVALYRGDFLAGFYDDWAVFERERLRELYLAALERLLALGKLQGAYEEALNHALRLVAEDPLREEGHQEVMRLYHLLGRTREALQQYEHCREVLKAELGIEPMTATTALYQEIAAQANLAGQPHLPQLAGLPRSPLLEGEGRVPLVGRVEERTGLLDCLEEAVAGRGGLVLLEGETGIGKTRLLQEVARDAEWRGVRVLWGHGRELTDLPPYSLFSEVLRAGLTPLRAGQVARLVEGVWLRQLSLLLPELAEWLPDLPPRVALTPEQEQVRLLEALTRTVLALGQITPHLVILEDLQWADEATWEGLRYLASRLDGSQVLVIGSFRSGEVKEQAGIWQALQAVQEAGYRKWIELTRLTAEQTGELVRQGLGLTRAAPRFTARLYRETDGNPLFVLETLRTLHAEGLLYRNASGQWGTPWDEATTDYAELPVPSEVYQVIARRLARLRPKERRILNAAAVLGADIDFELLVQVSRLPQKEVLAGIRSLVQRGLLEEGPAGYAFSHDRIRQVVYDEMSATKRRWLHRTIGEVMEAAQPDQVDALAYHFVQAQESDKALHYSLQVARHAEAIYALNEALTHYTQALTFVDREDRTIRWEVSLRREELLGLLGLRDQQAVELAMLAELAGDDPQRQAEVYRRRSWLLAHLGHYDEAAEAARQALAHLQQLDEPAGQAAALIALGTITDWAGRPAQALPYLQRAVALYESQHDPVGAARAHTALGSTLLGVKAYDAARTALETAVALFRSQDMRLDEAETSSLLCILLMEQGDTEAALRGYQQALEIFRAIGFRYGEARALTNLANLYYVQGRLSRALDHYEQALALFRSLGSRRGEASVRINRASVLASVFGDTERAAADIEAALAYYRQVGDTLSEGHALAVLGEIALIQRQWQTARSHLQAGLQLLLEGGERWIAAQAYHIMVRLSLAEGQPEAALPYLEAAQAIVDELDLTDLAVNLLADRGAVLLALGRPVAALTATDEAMARLRPGVERAYLVPFVHYQVLKALGKDQEARSALEKAVQGLMAMLEDLPAEQRHKSLTRVPEHRALITALAERQASRRVVRLPRIGAPTGRPLREDEWVDVVWTVMAEEDEAIASVEPSERQRKITRRRRRLLRLLREAAEQGAAPTVDDLAEALGVGKATIKRDLAALRQAGHEVRTRGSRSR